MPLYLLELGTDYSYVYHYLQSFKVIRNLTQNKIVSTAIAKVST